MDRTRTGHPRSSPPFHRLGSKPESSQTMGQYTPLESGSAGVHFILRRRGTTGGLGHPAVPGPHQAPLGWRLWQRNQPGRMVIFPGLLLQDFAMALDRPSPNFFRALFTGSSETLHHLQIDQRNSTHNEATFWSQLHLLSNCLKHLSLLFRVAFQDGYRGPPLVLPDLAQLYSIRIHSTGTQLRTLLSSTKEGQIKNLVVFHHMSILQVVLNCRALSALETLRSENFFRLMMGQIPSMYREQIQKVQRMAEERGIDYEHRFVHSLN
ncbi:hypothetical protein T439DRAFT_140234 [Meredithblackwellia eburnea MCA 4105]